MSERDKFLTEAMGECWHEVAKDEKWAMPCAECIHCRQRITVYELNRTGFDTWPGFGKLWEWAKKQEWFGDWVMMAEYKQHPEVVNGMVWNPVFVLEYINPDGFADAVYQFLQNRV